ncbi:putative quinol monooxygenase [Citrobacter sp. JGM124]|uniref:putative quinol monooxygenase n=1 Tax=Citrobacter sp. JGM124 TaxID=2799789 RepID=UPI001BA7CC80|nr:putative quinol monooxygenase [Citrobacter sp. JGM124]MBS0849236.1 antibiotic biosynthesis monooxygenase [Citrobacter sp. JGM124]
MLTVLAEIRTRPGIHHRQAVIDSFAVAVPLVLKEEGCHGYQPLVDHAANVAFQTTAPDSIFMIEKWETAAHLEAHLQTAHMKEHHERVKDSVLDVHIHILEDALKA